MGLSLARQSSFAKPVTFIQSKSFVVIAMDYFDKREAAGFLVTGGEREREAI